MARAKIWFLLGLGAMISLLYFSALRQQQIAGYEYAILSSLTLAALLFDYLKLNQFLTVLEKQRQIQCSHDRAIGAALTATLRWPLLVRLVGIELVTLYYAFLAKFDGNETASEDRPFSYSASSNANDVFLFVALSQLPFLPFIHILLETRKGPGPAWVITLLTLWSVIWYLAQVEAVKFRPIELSDTHLKYRFGLFWTADIPLTNIRLARSIDVGERLDRKEFFMSPLGSTRNVILQFDSPIHFSGPYLLSKRRKKAAISLDDPSHFLGQLALRGVATG